MGAARSAVAKHGNQRETRTLNRHPGKSAASRDSNHEREKQTMNVHPMPSSISSRTGRRLGLAGALCALLSGVVGVGAGHLPRGPVERRVQASRRFRAGAAASHLLLRPGKSHRVAERPRGRSADGRACAAHGGATCSRWGSSATRRRSSTGPDDKDGTKLLAPGQEQITVLGEAFGAIRVLGQTVTGYRQLINRPFINPQDSRMMPNTFEAYTLTGHGGRGLLHRRLHHEEEEPRVGQLRLDVERSRAERATSGA